MIRKILLVAVSCALSATIVNTLPAQTPKPAGNPFLDEKTNTIDDLHAAITKQPYTFHAGNYVMHLTFHANGTGEEEDWKFKWHAKDAQTIELTLLDAKGAPTPKKTTLTFSPDYTTYSGFHFDGIMKVTGEQVVKQ